MKYFFKLMLISVLLSSANNFAQTNWEWVQDEVAECRNSVIVNEDQLICSKSLFKIFKQTEKYKKVKTVPFHLYEHLHFGFPDDSTSWGYSYLNLMLSKSNESLGYQHIFSIHNSEGEWSYKIKVYYTLKGKLLGVFIEFL